MSNPDHPSLKPLRNGPVWAAILASAIGCASFGVLTDLSEVFKLTFAPKLVFYKPTGDLSGKSTLAVLAWIASWLILHLRWKQRHLEHTGLIASVAIGLVLLALVATFPPFFELIAGQ